MPIVMLWILKFVNRNATPPIKHRTPRRIWCWILTCLDFPITFPLNSPEYPAPAAEFARHAPATRASSVSFRSRDPNDAICTVPMCTRSICEVRQTKTKVGTLHTIPYTWRQQNGDIRCSISRKNATDSEWAIAYTEFCVERETSGVNARCCKKWPWNKWILDALEHVNKPAGAP